MPPPPIPIRSIGAALVPIPVDAMLPAPIFNLIPSFPSNVPSPPPNPVIEMAPSFAEIDHEFKRTA